MDVQQVQAQAQAVIEQVKNKLSAVIAHQAEQLLERDKIIGQQQAAIGQLQQQLQIAAQQVAAAQEPKTSGSVSGAPIEDRAPDAAPSETEPA